MAMDLRFPGRSDMLGTLASAAAESTDVSALVGRLKKDVFRNRLRLREFFKDFDPLRAGVVTASKFRTALEISGLVLNDPQLTKLSRHYADPLDPNRVRYEPLLTEIESVFTSQGMEMDPGSTVGDFTPTLAKSVPVLDDYDAAKLDELVAKLAHTVKVRQLMIRSVFDDYYKNVNSPIVVDQVTQSQFRNGMSQLGLTVSMEEVDLLNKAFAGASPGYVDYVAFACAVDESERTFSTREPRSFVDQPLSSGFRKPHYKNGGLDPAQPGRPPTSFHQPRTPVDYPANPQLEALMQKLQDKALQTRLRVADFFKDFDKHGDGTVTQPQFIKRLAVAYDKMGLGLSESEVQLLLTTYGKTMRHGATHVMWRAFVGDIEKIFTTPNMEKDPYISMTYRNVQQDVVKLSPPQKEAAVQKLILDLRKRVEVRRVLVKPLFSDFMGAGVDHITRSQMIQSLSRFGVELTTEQATLLFERYDTLARGTVNMVAFVRDIDPYETFSDRIVKRHVFPQDPDFGSMPTMKAGFWKEKVPPLSSTFLPGRPSVTNDQPTLVPTPTLGLPELLSKLQRTAVQHRLRVEETFKDFDRHRDGTITIPQFQQSLALTFGSNGLPLSEKDVELLIDCYKTTKSGQIYVLWKRFVEDVASIFTTKGLEKTPLASPTPLKPDMPRLKAALTYEEEQQAAAILGRFRDYCATRRVLVKPFFTDAELNRRSMRVVDHCTKSQFSQCLSRLGLELANDELDILVRKFDDKSDGWVNYVDFAVLVDEDEKSSNRDAGNPPHLGAFAASGNFYAQKTAAVQPGRPPAHGDQPGLLPNRASVTALGSLMRRLQEKVIQFKIPVADSFTDFDRHKLGAISKSQFRRGLNFAFGDIYMRENVTANEISLLETTYAREMLDGAIFVGWKEFCNDINAAVSTPGLEKDPYGTPTPVMIPRATTTLSDAEEARVAFLLGQMKLRFSIRAVYVKAPFHDFALSSNSPIMVDHCTRKQFMQGLARLGIEPTPSDLDLLFRKYDDLGEGSVNYVKFSVDVDPTETFSTRERLPAMPVPITAFTGGFLKPKVHEDLLRSM